MRVRVWLFRSDQAGSADEVREHGAGKREEGHSRS
jgi:hypothetical protein